MALVESAEGMSQTVMMDLSKASVSASVRIGQKGVSGTLTALHSLIDALRQVSERQTLTGKVSLQTFARVSRGERQIIEIGETRVAREITNQLRRLGVVFAVEQEGGQRIFHVQGADAQVVAHALDVASQRVDERIARNRAKHAVADKIEDAVSKKKQDVVTAQTLGVRKVADHDRSEPAR